jgi:hypothetical protein
MCSKLTSELRNHPFGNEHEAGASRASSGISATCRRALPEISLLPIGADDSPAARPCDSGSAYARRRIMRADLSVRSGPTWPAAHFCALLQTAPTAHLRCPWPTPLHPGRELPGHTARRRRLKIFNPNQRSVMALSCTLKDKATAGAVDRVTLS